MRNLNYFLLALLLLSLLACTERPVEVEYVAHSPSKNITVEFHLSRTGTPQYNVKYNGTTVIDSSELSFNFKDQPDLGTKLKVVNTETHTINEDWDMPWGEQLTVNNYYNQMLVKLEEVKKPKRKINIYFRVYNDGIGFRYEFLEQNGVDSVIILDENTEFNLTGNHTCWWIPGDWDIYEHLYNTTKFTEIDALSKANHKSLGQTYIPENAVNTPISMRTENGLHLSFHEANLTDYAGMTLKIDKENLSMTSELVGSDRLGYKVKRALPFKTPWRTIQIAEKATDLIESKLIVNLNEPNKLDDVSWFTPMKYVGIWWEMHLDVASWDYGMVQNSETGKWEDKGKAHGRHGATTKNAKRYIDFAAENNIKGLLVEGWNTGWERWIGFEDREGVFDFVTPYPDYDLDEVVRYGREKGVEVIMHHETSAAVRTYDQQMDTAYALMQKHGIHSVKTGYVGKIIPKGEYHHGQWMVQHYRRALTTAAKYQVAINAHEPIKATGLRRTYPNAISREGLRGQEFNAWSSDGGNPPEHLSIIAFTRMLAGPIDFTPGVFAIDLKTKPDNQINTTLAHQLASYVVIYSPIQMACDLPQNYKGNPALQFIKDVGVDWQQTKVLNGEIGDFVTIARQERETGNWFVGGITDEEKRITSITFDFLEEGKEYEARIYRDADDAHYKNNPKAFEIEKEIITKDMTKRFTLAPGGGFAISLIEKKTEE